MGDESADWYRLLYVSHIQHTFYIQKYLSHYNNTVYKISYTECVFIL